jgi:drug/metabolite transporter (DMT)-like permease/GT2 family glycosyltransferase
MRARIWAAIVVASVGWGTVGIATRAVFTEGVGPYTVVGMRTLIAAAAVLTYAALRRRPWPSRRWWRLGGVIGLTNYTIPTLLFVLAVQYASAGFLGLLVTNIPPVTAVWAHFLLRDERLNRRKALGLLLAMAGVGVLIATGESGLPEGARPGLAVALILIGIVVASFGGVHARMHAPGHDLLHLAGPQFALGTLVLVPAMLALEGLPRGISAAGWGLITYIALVGTFVPSLLFFWMLQRVSATTASLPSYLIPAIALTGGALLLGEQVTTVMGIGGILILAGVLLTEHAEAGLLPAGPSSDRSAGVTGEGRRRAHPHYDRPTRSPGEPVGRQLDKVRRSLQDEGLVRTTAKATRYTRRRLATPWRRLRPRLMPRTQRGVPSLRREIRAYRRLRPRPAPDHGTLFSVICPVFDTDPVMLRAAIRSVRRQTYPNWELLLIDDGSTAPGTRRVLRRAAGRRRIRVLRHDANRGITAASNLGIESAAGQYAIFLDHDDELAPTALEWCAACAPTADLVYSDEHKIDRRGRPSGAFHKPAWSPRLLTGLNYVNHLTGVRTELLRRMGGLRPGFEGAQDHDLLLRLAELPLNVAHLPNLLYRWRSWSGSVAGRATSKVAAEQAGLRALQEAIDRRGWPARAGLGAGSPFNYRIHWLPQQPPPLVKVVLPTRDRLRLLRVAVEGVLHRTDGVAVHLVVVDNGSVKPKTLDYLRRLSEEHPNVTVVRHDDAFNYSQLVNAGAAAGPEAPYVLLLNNDVVIHHRAWLQQLVGWMADPEISAVGAKLLFPDGRIQHAGVVTGIGGIAGHYALEWEDTPILGNLHDQAREVNCATAACLLVRSSVWKELGGFNEDLPVDFQDVDFCLRLRTRLGGIILYDPTYPLGHDQGSTRGLQRASNAYTLTRMRFLWGEVIDAGDPYYNPHLTLLDHSLRPAVLSRDPGLRRKRLRPRVNPAR